MKNVAAAIEFGTSKIITLHAESGSFTRCEIIGSGTVPYDGYMNGRWNNMEQLPKAIEDAIHAAEVESKRHIRDIYVGVPCEYIHVATGEAEAAIESQDGRVSDEDIDRVMDAVAGQLNLAEAGGNILHRSPAWFSIDGGKKTMSPMGIRGRMLSAKVSFVTADPSFIRDVRGYLSQLGITVNAFLSPSLGTAILLMSFEERDRTPILIDVGYLNTEFSVVEGDAITYHAVLPIGGGDISAELSRSLEIGMREAELIKRDFIFVPDEFDAQNNPEVRMRDGTMVTFPREYVQETVLRVVDEMVDLLRQTILDAGSCIAGRSQVYLTGGGIVNMRGGKEYLAEKLSRPVKIPVVRAARLNNPRFSSSLGLMDLVFDSIEHESANTERIPGKLSNIKNMLRR